MKSYMQIDLTAMIERHEGNKPVAYQDSLGIWTVGVGHNMSRPLSAAAIQQILSDDIADATNDCLHAFPWFPDLTQPRQAALIDMCFNLGLHRLQGFKKFLTAMARGDYDTAANEMLDSLWAKQTGRRSIELAGLIRGASSDV
jgi:lysozyme